MDLERQFIDFTKYVPYLDGNENVYSFRLVNLILAIGAHVDSVFKEMFRCSDFSTKYPDILKKINDGKATITDYREIEKEYYISKRKVVFKRLPERETIFPFQQFGTKSPDWWSAYNKIKHEFSQNFKMATLKTARDALACAFLLNVVHKPAILRLFEYGVVKSKYPEWVVYGDQHTALLEEPTINVLYDILKTTIYPPLYVETNLFYFDYESPNKLSPSH